MLKYNSKTEIQIETTMRLQYTPDWLKLNSLTIPNIGRMSSNGNYHKLL